MNNNPTGLELVREFFPDISDDDAGDILWNRTGYPCFWEGDPVTHFRKQIAEFKVNCDAGMNTCEFCSNAIPSDSEDWLCETCSSLQDRG